MRFTIIEKCLIGDNEYGFRVYQYEGVSLDEVTNDFDTENIIEGSMFDDFEGDCLESEIFYIRTFSDDLKKELQIMTHITMEEYLNSPSGEAYEEGELWDYPLDEVNHIIENMETKIKRVLLIEDRLYEILEVEV